MSKSAVASFRATSFVVEFARLYSAEYGHGGALGRNAFEAEMRRDGRCMGISASIAVGASSPYVKFAWFWDRHVCHGLQVEKGECNEGA